MRAECAASASPREPEFEWSDAYPLTSNDAAATARVRAVFDGWFGERSTDLDPVSASEDFSVIPDALGAPYCYWGLGDPSTRRPLRPIIIRPSPPTCSPR